MECVNVERFLGRYQVCKNYAVPWSYPLFPISPPYPMGGNGQYIEASDFTGRASAGMGPPIGI